MDQARTTNNQRPTTNFSVHSRPEILQQLQSKTFDLLIIGGGITGAGIALDAASRGLSVALVEKRDFAFGTSSRSTKLIHGGLRYLKQLEFGLVKEVGSERAVVHKLAPHLVIPEKMLLPLSEGKSMGYWLTSIGLKIYDWLAGVKEEDRRRMLTRPQTLKAEPLLKKEGIKGGALYAEYRTDDARLTIEIMKTAARFGTTALNYAKVVGFQYDENGKINGAKVQDEISLTEFSVSATVVVNATGPWVDEVRQADHTISGKRLHLTKGVHIVVDKKALPIKQAIYFEVADGRMIFAIPRHTKTYIGTTDTTYKGSKDEVHATPEDIQYLLAGVNQNFEGINLTTAQVESSWAGLRPLIHEEGKSESELSRKDEIFQWTSGLISIAGGKLTGYRKMAERVVDMVVEDNFSERNVKSCFTQEIPITENPFKNFHEVKKYNEEVANRLKPFHLETMTGYLVSNYGSQVDEILKAVEGITESGLLQAELKYCLNHEMVVYPEDFLLRRTGMALFDRGRYDRVLVDVLKILPSVEHIQ
jgi:glycerol-3-phosphate dehydrogenase